MCNINDVMKCYENWGGEGCNWQLAAHESVAAGGSTNDIAAPEWSNQTYLTL